MINHNSPTFDESEISAASRILSCGWVAQGPEVELFESELCDYFSLPLGHVAAVSSGSAALYLALWALNSKSKRIGLPVYACAAVRNAVYLINGSPIYLDCAKDTPNLNFNIADNEQLDIVIAPSIFGIPIDVPVNRKYLLIEDIAQAFGARAFNNPIGLRGEIGICSFYATKMITTGGQGGAVISRNKSLIDAIKDYRNFDCRDDSLARFNFQMTDLQASIGRVQLNKLPEFIKRREKIFSIYRESGLPMLDASQLYMEPVRYRAVINVNDPKKIVNGLMWKGIKAIIPVESWELLDHVGQYPIAQQLTKSSVSLPIYPSLSDENSYLIANVVKELL